MKTPGILSKKGVIRFMKYGIPSLILVILIFLLSAKRDESPTSASDREPPQAISPYIPENMDFCGEKVPLDNYDVYESLERELIVSTYFHSQTLLHIKRAGRYFPVIEPILRKQGVPDDFKYLMVIESNLSDAVSPSGAAGFWQLLESTAKDYNLIVNDNIDERYNLEKATEAACLFIKESYEKYNSWTLSAASYNVGRKGVDRQIERQGETDYYNLLFNEETARYVFRILAAKAVLTQPEKYYFHVPEAEKYNPIPYRTDTVTKSIKDLGTYARSHQTSYKMLKYLNAWLRDNTLPVSEGQKFLIKVPVKRQL